MNTKSRPDGCMRVALVGWGSINRRVAELLAARDGGRISVVAICLRDLADAVQTPPEAVVVTEPSELADHDVDFVIEAAGRAAVAQWAEPALRHAPAVAIASTSALCDTALLDRLIAAAKAHGSRLLIPPGALAGIDAIAAASVLPLDEVVHRIVKPPVAWAGTPAENAISLASLMAPATFFDGSAREAAAAYPQNANVAVISAFAGIGLDRTRVCLVADPSATGNRHELHAVGRFGRLDVAIENRPLPGNPRSSEMAALGLVRLIENANNPLVV